MTATVKSDVKVRYEEHGGAGYNVVGELPGRTCDGQMVVVSAHHDAHFRAGMDDTSGTTQAMTIAKAMRMSGYRPQGSVVFLLTTGEESGYTDASYDFLVGSWYSITHTHADWPGKVAAQINLESQGGAGGRMGIATAAELDPWAAATAAANPTLTPYTVRVSSPVSTWTDAYPFLTNGIPAMTFSASGAAVRGQIPHQLRRRLPHRLELLRRHVEVGVPLRPRPRRQPAALQPQVPGRPHGQPRRGRPDPASRRRSRSRGGSEVRERLRRLSTAAAGYDARAAAIPAGHRASVNKGLMRVEKLLDSSLVAMAPDGSTVILPHQQVLWDTEGINDALAASPADPQAALDALSGVYQLWITLFFSDPVYYTECLWQTPATSGSATAQVPTRPHRSTFCRHTGKSRRRLTRKPSRP